jgi:hypothetical protein
MPIPYLGATTALGFFYSLGLKLKFSKYQKMAIAGSIFLVALTFLANQASSVALSYEEMKRLAVLVCATSTSIFFFCVLRTESSTLKFQNQSLFYLGLGQLLATRIFWELPDTLQYSNYSWFKFAGANALILVVIQFYMISRYSSSIKIWIFLGLGLTAYAFSQSAKSIAFITLFIFLLRFSICRNPKLIVGIIKKVSKDRFKVARLIGVNVVLLLAVRWLLGTGLLGERPANLVNQYGSGVVSTLNNARPEFQYSLKILSQQPVLGYGTISNPLDKVYVNINTSDIQSFAEQRFLISRILGEGFNLHSWTFDLVVRGGFLCFIPIFIYFVQLVKCLVSIDLIRDYPGLVYMVVVSMIDLFFSPYSWFVSSQIAFTFIAIYLRHMIIYKKGVS